MIEMQDRDIKTVHVLKAGFPVCGFTRDTPDQWPEGQVWTHEYDLENVTCEKCKVTIDPARQRPLIPNQ